MGLKRSFKNSTVNRLHKSVVIFVLRLKYVCMWTVDIRACDKLFRHSSTKNMLINCIIINSAISQTVHTRTLTFNNTNGRKFVFIRYRIRVLYSPSGRWRLQKKIRRPITLRPVSKAFLLCFIIYSIKTKHVLLRTFEILLYFK